MNSRLRARIEALEGPPPVQIPTIVIVMKDGKRHEMQWNEGMIFTLEHEDDIADIRPGDADMANMCRAMLSGGQDHADQQEAQSH